MRVPVNLSTRRLDQLQPKTRGRLTAVSSVGDRRRVAVRLSSGPPRQQLSVQHPRCHQSWFNVSEEDLSEVRRRPVMDAPSQAWAEGLQATGHAHEDCVSALHAVLLRVARHEVARRAGSLQLHGPELEDIAQQATDDALMAIRAKVAGFRGESRFTTWAYRFVMFEVSTKMGRHFWRDAPAVHGRRRRGIGFPTPWAPSPRRSAEHRELFAALRRAIDEDLTALAATGVRGDRPQRGPDGRVRSRARRQPQRRLQDAVRCSTQAPGEPAHRRIRASRLTRMRRDERRTATSTTLLAGDSVDAGCAAGFEVLHVRRGGARRRRPGPRASGPGGPPRELPGVPRGLPRPASRPRSCSATPALPAPRNLAA